MKVVAFIQARLRSTRLPGKVLRDLGGEPMLARVLHRTARAKNLDSVVVATTTQTADDAIAQLSEVSGWDCYRGNHDDVLDRYYQAARQFHADAVVRITSDCPLTDPGIVDIVVKAFLDRQPDVDYVNNSTALTELRFPRGLDTEVIRIDALERAWREDSNPKWREHVSPYIYRNPDLFRIYGVSNNEDYSWMRWTVDTYEDLVLIRNVYEHFGHDKFTWRQVLDLMAQRPDWQGINRGVEQKTI